MENIMKTAYCILGLVATVSFVTTVSEYKMDEYKAHIVLTESNDYPSVSHIENELDCMAMNIYREAEGEPFEGKVAVAQVTMNRVAHEDFPDSVCGVVYEKNVFMQRVVCQFSWHCSNRIRARTINARAYEESYEIAKKVILEDFELESVKDAIYFHSDSVSPNWRYQQVVKIGNHIFYKAQS